MGSFPTATGVLQLGELPRHYTILLCLYGFALDCISLPAYRNSYLTEEIDELGSRGQRC